MKTGYTRLGTFKGTKEVLFGGCIHLGNESHDDECMRNFLDAIRVKPFFLMGDLIEAIMPLDKRFRLSSHEKSIMAQVDETVDIFDKFKANCLGMISGNHEDTPSAHMGDLTESMAKRLRVRYLSDTSIQTVACPKGDSNLFLAHPCFTVSSSAANSADAEKAKCSALRKRLNKLCSSSIHCRLIYHLHQGIVDPIHSWHEPKLGMSHGKMSEDYEIDIPAWTISGPSMFRTYSEGIGNYASRRLFAPVDIGWMGVVYDTAARVVAVHQYRSNGKIKQTWEQEIVK